jgi:hypothetical protein
VNREAFTVRTRTGSYDLTAAIRRIGEDLLVAVWGGERPHIGAVAAAQPRPSLKDPAQLSASVSVLCYVGHKEDLLAREIALAVSSRVNSHVVVTAGIHWDNLDQEGIDRVVKNSRLLTKQILEKVAAGNGVSRHGETER